MIALLSLFLVALAGFLFWPLGRALPSSDAPTGEEGRDILARQLAVIDGEESGGRLTTEDAAALRLEISRRLLLEADDKAAPFVPDRAHPLVACGAGVLFLGATAGLYLMLGRGDLARTQPPVPVMSADAGPVATEKAELAAFIPALRTRLKTNPDDARGWDFLGAALFQSGDYIGAANAYGRAFFLDPSRASAASSEGEALVRAADGEVSPSARSAFEAALRVDPRDMRARYFLALAMQRDGRPEDAIAQWMDILRDAPADAPYIDHVRRTIQVAAAQAGLRVDAPWMAATPPRFDPAQMAQIRAMVQRLATRLADQPRDLQGWVRLMRAYMVLGEKDAASRAWHKARAAFVGDAAALGEIDRAARRDGVPDKATGPQPPKG